MTKTSNNHNNLKPALILGSGFHRHVFGEQRRSNQHQSLYDWHSLIDATAERMHVACPSRQQPPVLRWETLIGRAIREGFRDADGTSQSPHVLPAYQVEIAAKKQVAQVLGESSADYPISTRASIPRQSHWGCVISLNFDHAWNPELDHRSLRLMPKPRETSKSASFTAREVIRLNASIAPDASASHKHTPRVWFPNGSILRPSSIRMGLHDYGDAPGAIRLAFNQIKAWERNFLGVTSARYQPGFEALAAALRFTSEQEASLLPFLDLPALPLSWVAEFLYRPLYFAGVGLSEQETGLWWLLAQRVRNLARVAGSPDNARVRILVHRDDRPAFWATRPFGIESIQCADWDEGWQRLLGCVDIGYRSQMSTAASRRNPI